jgi:hypothetical protein
MWGGTVEPDWPQMAVYAIRRMRIAYRATKATDTHSECLILIAFPREPWLRERGAIVRCLFGFPQANVVQSVWFRYAGVMGCDTSGASGSYCGVGAGVMGCDTSGASGSYCGVGAGVMGCDTSGASGSYCGVGAVLWADVEGLLLSHVVWLSVWACLRSGLEMGV